MEAMSTLPLNPALVRAAGVVNSDATRVTSSVKSRPYANLSRSYTGSATAGRMTSSVLERLPTWDRTHASGNAGMTHSLMPSTAALLHNQRAQGFFFRKRRKSLNVDIIDSIDVKKITDEVCLEELNRAMSTVVYSRAVRDPDVTGGAPTIVLKWLTLLQYATEYMLFVQGKSVERCNVLEERCTTAEAERLRGKEAVDNMQLLLHKAEADCAVAQAAHQQSLNLLTHVCPICDKAFQTGDNKSSFEYLQEHMWRRHPDDAPPNPTALLLQLKQTKSQMKAVAKERDAAAATAKTLVVERNDLRNAVSALEASLQEMENVIMKHEAAAQHMALEKAEIIGVRHQLERDVEQAAERTAETEQQVVELRAVIAALTTERDVNQAKFDAEIALVKRDQSSAAHTHDEGLHQLSAQLDEAKALVHDLEASLDVEKNKAAEQSAIIANQKDEIARLHERLGTVKGMLGQERSEHSKFVREQAERASQQSAPVATIKVSDCGVDSPRTRPVISVKNQIDLEQYHPGESRLPEGVTEQAFKSVRNLLSDHLEQMASWVSVGTAVLAGEPEAAQMRTVQDVDPALLSTKHAKSARRTAIKKHFDVEAGKKKSEVLRDFARCRKDMRVLVQRNVGEMDDVLMRHAMREKLQLEADKTALVVAVQDRDEGAAAAEPSGQQRVAAGEGGHENAGDDTLSHGSNCSQQIDHGVSGASHGEGVRRTPDDSDNDDDDEDDDGDCDSADSMVEEIESARRSGAV